MKPVLIECPTCSSFLRLSEELLARVAGRSGKISCKGCGTRIRLDARQGMLVVEFLGTPLRSGQQEAVGDRPTEGGEREALLVGSSDASGLEPRHHSSFPPPLPEEALRAEAVPLEALAQDIVAHGTARPLAVSEEPSRAELEFFARGGSSFPAEELFPQEERNTLSPQTVSYDASSHEEDLFFPLVPSENALPSDLAEGSDGISRADELDGVDVVSVRGERLDLRSDLDSEEEEEEGAAPVSSDESPAPQAEVSAEVPSADESPAPQAEVSAEVPSADESPAPQAEVSAELEARHEPREVVAPQREIDLPPSSSPCHQVEEEELQSVQAGVACDDSPHYGSGNEPAISDRDSPAPMMASSGDRMPKIQTAEWFKSHSRAASIPPAPPRPWEVRLKSTPPMSLAGVSSADGAPDVDDEAVFGARSGGFSTESDADRVSYPPLPSPFATKRRDRGGWKLPVAIAASLAIGGFLGAARPFERQVALAQRPAHLSPVAQAMLEDRHQLQPASARPADVAQRPDAPDLVWMDAQQELGSEELDSELLPGGLADGEVADGFSPDGEADVTPGSDTGRAASHGAASLEVGIPAAAAQPTDEEAKALEGNEGEEERVEEPVPLEPFSTRAANMALREATAQASSCRKSGDPSGLARVVVTFSPSGRVTRATVSGPPFAGTPTGGCIASVFRGARVPEFSGDYVTVSKTVTID